MKTIQLDRDDMRVLQKKVPIIEAGTQAKAELDDYLGCLLRRSGVDTKITRSVIKGRTIEVYPLEDPK